ncbi:LOW QUALITY PROTEIN: hypothetical protein HID58_040010, partial [Brassica napus]
QRVKVKEEEMVEDKMRIPIAQDKIMIPSSLFVANICKDMDSRSCLSIQHKCFMVATCDRERLEAKNSKEVSDTVVSQPEENKEEIVVEEEEASDNGLKLEKESTGKEGTVELGKEVVPPPPVQKGKWKGLDPVVFLRDETVINGIKRFYGINDESFPLNDFHIKTINIWRRDFKESQYSRVECGKKYKRDMRHEVKVFHKREEESIAFKIKKGFLGCYVEIKQRVCWLESQGNEGNVKRIYYVSRLVKDVLELNLAVGQKIKNDGSEAVKVNSSTIAIGCWKVKAILTVMVTTVDCDQLIQRLT